MKVLKFGGAAIATADAMLKAKSIIDTCNSDDIVVVSAIADVTDNLYATARMAAAGDMGYDAALDTIKALHTDMLMGVCSDNRRTESMRLINMMLDELSNIMRGVFLVRDLSTKTIDTILSYGSRLSAIIMSTAAEDCADADAMSLIKTRTHHGRHLVDFPVTDALITDALGGRDKLTIIAGCIASDAADGDITTLGRGGSDYTAAIIAAALGAELLEVWTDADGFMTADPAVVKNAYVIERLSYVEAIEMCNFGANVIYPPAIFPAIHKEIPIVVKNTFNPQSSGTYISKEKVEGSEKPIRGISSVADSCLITVQGLGMVGVVGVNYRIFKALSKAGVSVFFVAQAASENNTSIGVKESDADRAVAALTEEFARDIAQGEIEEMRRTCGLATIAIVGENMRHTPGIAGKLFGTLGRNGINVIASAQGATEANISFVVDVENRRKAMNVIHDSFFLSEYQVLNIFIAGTGWVGGNLIEQISRQQEKLLNDSSLQVRVVGISNSRKYIADRDGIDLKSYKQLLDTEGRPSSPETIRDEIIRMNIFNSVFVDCTASPAVAAIYGDLLEKSISVVAANKTAASSDYATYNHLKQVSRRTGAKFLFETNVGAGLPVINTIGSLRNSGDRILKIEAVVSGTLNYIFNVMDETVTLSRAIKMAQEAGYAEPDPRIDLSGADVVRKIVILAREAGYTIEQSDVHKELFIPAEYFEGTIDEFWAKIPALDAQFEAKRKELQAKGLRRRFIATFDHGEASVALREVTPDSPFYNLDGSNNVISLTTERYREYPMQIKGYGAGAAVTAAGVFADIIGIANI
jgi:aspartokinase/homoserine dehydrogenase 1